MIHQLLNKKHSPKSISANFWEKAVFLFLRRLLIFTGFFLLPFIKEEVRYITPASFKTDGRRTVSPNGLFGLNLYRFEIMKDHDVDASEISSKQVTSYRLMALWPSHEIYPSKGKVHQLKGTVVEIPIFLRRVLAVFPGGWEWDFCSINSIIQSVGVTFHWILAV